MSACSAVPTPFGQTFTPSVPSLVAVDFFFLDRGLEGRVMTIDVVIKDGGPTGPILGSSSLTLTSSGDPILPAERVEHFDLPTAISLTPGNTYFIGALFPDCNTFDMRGNFFDGYPRGTAVGVGPVADFGFRTYFLEKPVGGEILGTDSATLFVAGAFANAGWIISIAGVAAGIVGFVLRRIR